MPRRPGRSRIGWFAHCALFVLIAAAATCGDATQPAGECSGYGNPQTSLYVLPYPVGAAYRVLQGNCALPPGGHHGANRYSYDFDMEIGTPVTAARAGMVAEVQQSHMDGEVAETGFDNFIVVRHTDGTADLYAHFTHNGAVVSVGMMVAQGDLLGLSGNTGNTGNIPHLHFSVQTCDPVIGGSDACSTIPSVFRNAQPNPGRLADGQTYTAGAR